MELLTAPEGGWRSRPAQLYTPRKISFRASQLGRQPDGRHERVPRRFFL